MRRKWKRAGHVIESDDTDHDSRPVGSFGPERELRRPTEARARSHTRVTCWGSRRVGGWCVGSTELEHGLEDTTGHRARGHATLDGRATRPLLHPLGRPVSSKRPSVVVVTIHLGTTADPAERAGRKLRSSSCGDTRPECEGVGAMPIRRDHDGRRYARRRRRRAGRKSARPVAARPGPIPTRSSHAQSSRDLRHERAETEAKAECREETEDGRHRSARSNGRRRRLVDPASTRTRRSPRIAVLNAPASNRHPGSSPLE